MTRGTSVLLILAVVVVGQALTPESYYTPADLQRLKAQFGAPYGSELEAVYYSILGFTLLDEPIPQPQDACKTIQANMDATQVESIFYGTVSANILKTKGKQTCQLSTGSAQTVLTSAISEESSTEVIYQAVAALHSLSAKVDAAKVTAALTGALKTDDSPLSHGFAFLAASYLSGDLTKIHDLIEDVIAQADEVDEKYLQFDGGLYTTAVVLDGAYKLAATAKKAPTLTEDKVIKFTNYFTSRKHTLGVKNGAAILSIVKTLTDNQFHIPIAVTLHSQVSVSDATPTVQVRVSNLLGKSLGKMTVTADTARHIGDDAVVLSKKQLTASAADNSLFELDLMKVKPARGFYKLIISVAPQAADKRLIGITGAEVEVKVTTQVAVENVEIGVGDKDQSTAPKTTMLQHPNKMANALEADHQQKVLMKFQLRDRATNAVMAAHQTFVRLTGTSDGQEIIFVAEPDTAGTYKFDLDVGANAKEFGYKSGKYSMDLVVGDAVIQNPFSWTVADVSLTFQEGPSVKEEDVYHYSARPEIKHVFREPEQRPSIVMSNLFTGLVMLPFLILIALWMRLGVNISSFPVSMSAIGFHLGLAAIFGLYYMYWVNLTMFATLRYLAILCVPTFLFGNRLLSSIAAKRK